MINKQLFNFFADISLTSYILVLFCFIVVIFSVKKVISHKINELDKKGYLAIYSVCLIIVTVIITRLTLMSL